jgi:hypothetical protein
MPPKCCGDTPIDPALSKIILKNGLKWATHQKWDAIWWLWKQKCEESTENCIVCHDKLHPHRGCGDPKWYRKETYYKRRVWNMINTAYEISKKNWGAVRCYSQRHLRMSAKGKN